MMAVLNNDNFIIFYPPKIFSTFLSHKTYQVSKYQTENIIFMTLAVKLFLDYYHLITITLLFGRLEQKDNKRYQTKQKT